MADPLSITASIIGIATLGFQIAKGLYKIADGIGSAGEEVRLYAGEINEFSKLLNHIRAQILATPDIPFSSRSLIKDVIDICDKVLQPFHCLQKTLESFFTRFKQSPNKLKKFGLGVGWVFCYKKKLLFYLDTLRNQHRILNTALDLANLQTTKDRTPQSICILQLSLENSMAAINMSPNSSTGGSIFSIRGTNEQPSRKFLLSTSERMSNLSSNSENAEPPPQIENDLDPQSSTDLVAPSSISQDHEDQLTAHEMQLIEHQIDQYQGTDLGTTADELWEDTRSLSRKAKRWASEALCSLETKAAASLGTLPSFTHKDYTVGWVCTRSIEYAVAEGMLDEQHPALPVTENDPNTYTLGRIIRHNVVLVCISAGTMDTGVASTAISEMLRSFPNIRIRLLVGIGDGVPNLYSDIRLGDVVVGSPTSSSDGLILFDSSGDEIVETGTLETPPRELRSTLSILQARHIRREPEIPRYIREMLEANRAMRLSFSAPDPGGDLLFQSYYEHLDKSNKSLRSCLECDPSQVIPRPAHRGRPAIHYGTIAWTNSTTKSGFARDAIARQKSIYSMEKGAMGLMNFFPCLVIRGIWNYSDSHWNTIWQGYAAATAAGYAKEILETVQTAQT
ncbi:nucleoside phosphorylase domain-containing protein [Aspergillus alliaceus]|uniref:nucleoside phosphorylase domain-containing protein n=1 Tax=Petromyces alliaceus TaxID=209559 RepID=UPI0012A75113|nr:nucleoside phosphorylase domain-containing protein [Aspergillus alliaceus]KAB8239574.1 nucleoside phosphorylase domain-containing protein [Aspergillus alliaceus]